MTDRARDANGRNDTHVARLTALYRTMARIRAFEEATDVAVREGLVKGAAHLSIGQEAIAAGVCINLRREDLITSTHRGHGHTIAKGADPQAMMCELFGREGGTCHGKGGSMHIADFSIGMLGANGVVAAGLPIAVGAAHAVKLAGDGRIAVCFFGDGAVNRGPFLESLNWAKVYALPVLFVCEDNKYAATTYTADLSAGPGPLARAQSLGVHGTTIDGNDVEAVDAAAATLLDKIRGGAGPQFLHADTYRMRGHTATDAAAYRKAEEVAKQATRDPLRRAAVRLTGLGVDPKTLDEIDGGAKSEIERAYAHAKAAPWPADALAYADIQDTGFGQWQ
jgi:TPP-dependent pyruvate/acetoin dehydrogenase alpha subunit